MYSSCYYMCLVSRKAFVVLCIPLLFAVGFSSWIIIYETVFAPTYYENPISEAFGFSQETTYNGQGQVPVPLNGYVINDTITYKYKLEIDLKKKDCNDLVK